MLRADIWQTSYTKLKPLNFPLVFQSLCTVLLRRRWLNVQVQGLSCTQRCHNVHTDAVNGEKCTVPDFINHKSYHLKGSRHIHTQLLWKEAAIRLCLQINDSSHVCHTILMLPIPFRVTQSFSREKEASSFCSL